MAGNLIAPGWTREKLLELLRIIHDDCGEWEILLDFQRRYMLDHGADPAAVEAWHAGEMRQHAKVLKILEGFPK